MDDFEIVIDKNSMEVQLKQDLVATLVTLIKPSFTTALNSCNSVIFNFCNVEQIDSIGIGFIIASYNTQKKRGGIIEVINISSEILDLFKSINLHKHFTLKGV